MLARAVMRRLASVAPVPAPALAAALQPEPLVQVTLTDPVASVAPESVLTLPKATAVVETVQFAVTVALTPSVLLCVPAKAAPGAASEAAAAAVAKIVALTLR